MTTTAHEDKIRKPIAYTYSICVPVGKDCHHTIPNLWHSETENDLILSLVHKSEDVHIAVAVSIITSFDYLLSDDITHGEAIRRLKLMRDARKKYRGYVL